MRPATWLPHSRAGRQEPYLRSLVENRRGEVENRRREVENHRREVENRHREVEHRREAEKSADDGKNG